jgi:hypothetical protein
VERWVKPEEFVELKEEAEELGFAGVMSGPLVRSSYRAGRLYRQAMEQRSAESQRDAPENRSADLRGDDPPHPPENSSGFLSGARKPYAAEHGTHV